MLSAPTVKRDSQQAMCTLLPRLYRGDSLPPVVLQANARERGRTFAEHYSTDGLLAKFSNGGSSAWLRWPLVRQVATHVGYRTDNPVETRFADHSPFISFSTSEPAAWHFLDRSQRKVFEPCPLEDATHFMWDLRRVCGRRVGPGHFAVRYRASTINVDRFREQGIERVRTGDHSRLGHTIGQVLVHGHIRRDRTVHTAELFDVCQYLRGADMTTLERDLVERALRYGEKWSEWLVFANDAEEGVVGPSCRIKLNRHLDLRVFARVSPPQPWPSSK